MTEIIHAVHHDVTISSVLISKLEAVENNLEYALFLHLVILNMQINKYPVFNSYIFHTFYCSKKMSLSPSSKFL